VALDAPAGDITPENARQLLGRGCAPAEAAAQAGYQDYSTFSRAYKKQFGRSPSADTEKEHDLQITTHEF